MTGYGRGQAQDQSWQVICELKSLNHRYLDLKLKTFTRLLPFEMKIRKKIRSTFSRGSIEVMFRFQKLEEDDLSSTIRKNVAQQYLKELGALIHKPSDSAETFQALSLLSLPGVVDEEKPPEEWEISERRQKADEKLITQALEKASESLIQSRQREGDHLESVLKEQWEKLSECKDKVEAQKSKALSELARRYRERVDKILEDKSLLSEDRIRVEVALIAEKSDISEELDRLDAHFKEWNELVKGCKMDPNDAIGRQLDFYTQEFHREWNTIGSKCQDAELSKCVVKAKGIVEKMREQVQNVQ
jgi:large subunit ribosomal protein L28